MASFYFQEPLCTSSHQACVQKTKLEPFNCLPKCSGLILSSFSKYEQPDFESSISKEIAAYNKYKREFQYPSELKGYKLLF